jgi:hypothetical protein
VILREALLTLVLVLVGYGSLGKNISAFEIIDCALFGIGEPGMA